MHVWCHVLTLNSPNSIAAWAPLQTPMGELTALPESPYLDLRGPTSKGKGRAGECTEWEGRGEERKKKGGEANSREGKGRDEMRGEEGKNTLPNYSVAWPEFFDKGCVASLVSYRQSRWNDTPYPRPGRGRGLTYAQGPHVTYEKSLLF